MIHCFSSLPSLEKHAGGRLLSLLVISLCLADSLIFIITLYGSTTLIFSIILFGIVYYEKLYKREMVKKSIQKTMTTFLKFSALNCNIYINLI